MVNHNARIVALDIGEKRIGVASANVVARLASPLQTIQVSEAVLQDITHILSEQTAIALVIGLPRNLQSEDTAQTKKVRDFGTKLKAEINLPIYWQDEALTSHVSKEKLKATNKPYAKGDIDALAACQILEDYLSQNLQDAEI
ncbi:MAG: Holliday junction resolvase RuvX [Candidatus Saccharimonadales bacterium]